VHALALYGPEFYSHSETDRMVTFQETWKRISKTFREGKLMKIDME